MMTSETIKALLEQNGFLVAINHFSEDVCPPFIILLNNTSNIFAENKVYLKIEKITLELYTRVNSSQIEEKLENVLDQNCICWDKSAPIWLDEEKMTERVYQIG